METINSFREEYSFLSNFYQHPFEYKGLVYPNAEAAFQAQKCADEEGKVKYTLIKNPVRAKQMGKKEANLPANWDEISPRIMEEIVTAKFSVPELAVKLLSTGDAFLEEGNHWHDNRWGKCTCDRCRDRESLNLLGNILMNVREKIADESKS
ncbi:MAG: NADAR family protein [Lachnospiraceae bacterium]|nr:NADAR family protein [Lachnospiraceae bacterium]